MPIPEEDNSTARNRGFDRPPRPILDIGLARTFGMMLRGKFRAEMPADLWTSDYLSIAAWSGAIALMYAGFIVFFANFGVGVKAICEFIKSKTWSILWCGPAIAIYANIFLYYAATLFLLKHV